jgi:SM-20-related protein
MASPINATAWDNSRPMNAERPEVRLSSALDVRTAAATYARAGRVQVTDVLEAPCAQRAYECLRNEVPWQLHFNDGDRTYDVPGDQVQLLPEANRVLLLDAIHAKAQTRFQYLFNNFPIYDVHAAGRLHELYIMRVFEHLNSEGFLAFARELTGVTSISLVDAQATLYRGGHFLTCHDDLVTGKGRVAAYVLNFTPQWRADWGGILNFIDDEGDIVEGYTPRFNALNVFKVPQRHAVSYVTPFAQTGRYSISGWFRAS